MAALYYSLVFALLLALTAADKPSCVYGDGESHCAVSSAPQRLLLHENKLIVGAIDYIYSFSLNLTSPDSSDISPTTYRTQQCEEYVAHQPALCRNFVRVVQPVNESLILVCGTNAFFPKCRFIQFGNLSDWEYMTEEEQKDLGFSPHSNSTNVAIMANNGRFFTATYFNFRNSQRTIAMSPLLMEGDGTFTIQTPKSSPHWINDPVTFISAYDIGDHIYFFAREPAYELSSSVVYSRVIRVCKNDPGFLLFADDTTLTFRTFQKARLRCRTTGIDGTNPYDYDRLQATYVLRPSDGGDPTLYAAFSSPLNGPEGAALCKFSFSAINTVFDDGEYLVQENSEWTQESNGAFDCSNGSERTEEQSRRHQLVYNIITPSNPQPMHTVLGDDILHVAVDIVEYDGSVLEIVILGQKKGLITQIIYYQGNIYKNTIRKVTEEITHLIVSKTLSDKKLELMFTTDSSIQAITLGKCTQYNTCFKCFDSNDPYCGWSESDERRCVNKLTIVSSSVVDVLTSNEETVNDICGPRTTTLPPDQPTNPSSCPHTTQPPSPTTDSTDDPTTHDEPTLSTTPDASGLDEASDGKKENTGLLAGATVGGFLAGVPVGLIVCYLFFNIFLKNKNKSELSPVVQMAGESCTRLHNNHNQSQEHTRVDKPSISNTTRCLAQSHSVTHRNHTIIKNVNQQNNNSLKEEDDVLTDLPLSKEGKDGLFPLQHPPLAVRSFPVPRGRTESTRWLRASESDWESSLSPVSSPV